MAGEFSHRPLSDNDLRANRYDLIARNVKKLGWIVEIALKEYQDDILPER